MEAVTRDEAFALLPALLPSEQRRAGRRRRRRRRGRAGARSARRFAALPGRAARPAPCAPAEPPQTGQRRVVVRRPGPHARGDGRLPRARADRAGLRGHGPLRRAARGRQGPATSRASTPPPPRHAAGPRARGLRRGDPRRPPTGRPRAIRTCTPYRGRPGGRARAALAAAERRGLRRPRARPAARDWTDDGGHGARAGSSPPRTPRTSTTWPGARTSSRSSRCPAATEHLAAICPTRLAARHRRRRPAVRPRAARSRARHRRLVRAVDRRRPAPPPSRGHRPGAPSAGGPPRRRSPPPPRRPRPCSRTAPP